MATRAERLRAARIARGVTRLNGDLAGRLSAERGESTTSIPDPQSTSNAPNRIRWDQPELQPKQQHRFICNFPVIMPRGEVTDAKNLAGLVSTNLEDAIKSFITAGKAAGKYKSADVISAVGATTSTAFLNALAGTPPTSVRDKWVSAGFGGEGKGLGDPEETWWKAAKQDDADEYIYRRISPYVVTAFTPPAYGANVSMASIMGAPANQAVDESKTKLKIDSATITLVSTLQDDLHFSLNFLYNIFALATTMRDTEQIVKPYLFTPQLWKEHERTLTVLDMGAWPIVEKDPKEDALKANAKYFDSTPIGIHKFNNPFVTGISFSDYSYKGESFLEATVTLGQSAGASDFYSYQTFRNSKTGGDTRYGRYSGLVKGKGIGDPTAPLAIQQRAISKAYGAYPTFWNKGGSSLTRNMAAVGHARYVRAASNARNDMRLDLVNEIMADAAAMGAPGRDGTSYNRRQGLLYPLLESLTEKEFREEQAQRSATRAADASAANTAARTRLDEAEATLRAQPWGADRAGGHQAGQADLGRAGDRAQEQRLAEALRQGGASPREVRQEREAIRQEQQDRGAEEIWGVPHEHDS